MKTTKLFGMICATILAATSVPFYTVSAGVEQDKGVYDGYHWELWNQYGQGNATMELGPKGTYTCNWSGIHNVLFRSGRKFEDYPQWNTLKSIQLDYEASVYRPNGNSYLCVYGWTKSPLVEYYIVENYGNWRPPGVSDEMRMLGTITVDGGTYEIYKGVHHGPSIEPGVEDFDQYWSVRVDGQLRSKGTIDIAKHFAEWEKHGMKMGGLYEVALNVEGWQSSGTATISKNDLNLEGGEPIIPEDEVQYTTPSGSGTSITDDFEGSGTLWKVRGDKAKYGFTEALAHGGKQSLYVTERSQSWHGLQAASDELKAGEKYNFSSYVTYKNKNYESVKYELGLQYKLDGDTKYDNLGSVSTSSEKWAELASEIEIPAGATDISLYVQSEYTEAPTAKDLLSFFLDDVKLTPLGAATTEPTTATTVQTTTTTVTTTTVTSVTEEIPQPSRRGDVNCDTYVDVSDAVLLARFLAEDSKAVITAVGKKNADCDGQDGITPSDVTAILSSIAKLITL